MTSRGLAFARAATVAAIVAAAAYAGDARAEVETGGFWERTIDPTGDEVDRLVDRAQELAGREDSEARAQAEELLARAIEIAPDAPRPRWELARLLARRGEHDGCAQHLRHLAAAEPDFEPPHSVSEAPFLLDLKLAECLGASGAFAEAADRLHRILARGVTSEARVYGWLAQLEMARGRLEAAGFALEQARRLRPHSAGFRFTAAVLLDRAGRPFAAREELRAALGRDPQLHGIRSPAGRFFPAADEHYTLGLAYAAKGEPHRAIIHFRHYLEESSVPLWDERAREHLVELGGEELPLALRIHGSATLDERAARAAIAAARPALEDCVREAPGVLLRARITTFAAGPREADRGGPRPGPRVLIDHAFSTSSDTLEEAVGCAEEVLRGLDLPRPRGQPGQYTTLEIPVLAP